MIAKIIGIDAFLIRKLILKPFYLVRIKKYLLIENNNLRLCKKSKYLIELKYF